MVNTLIKEQEVTFTISFKELTPELEDYIRHSLSHIDWLSMATEVGVGHFGISASGYFCPKLDDVRNSIVEKTLGFARAMNPPAAQ